MLQSIATKTNNKETEFEKKIKQDKFIKFQNIMQSKLLFFMPQCSYKKNQMYAQMYIKTLNPIYSNRDCSHFWGFHYNFCHIYLWGSIMEFKRNISIIYTKKI